MLVFYGILSLQRFLLLRHKTFPCTNIRGGQAKLGWTRRLLHARRPLLPRWPLASPVRYRGGIVGLWCRCSCPAYVYEANRPMGTVSFLVCDSLNHLQHPYQWVFYFGKNSKIFFFLESFNLGRPLLMIALLSSNQDINQFLVQAKIELQISYTTIKDFTS